MLYVIIGESKLVEIKPGLHGLIKVRWKKLDI